MSVTPPSSGSASSTLPAKAHQEPKPSLFLRLLRGIRQVVLCGRGFVAKNSNVRASAPMGQEGVTGSLKEASKEQNPSSTSGSSPTCSISSNEPLRVMGGLKKVSKNSSSTPVVLLVEELRNKVQSSPFSGVEVVEKAIADVFNNMADLEKGVAAFHGPHFDATYGLLYGQATDTSERIDKLFRRPHIDATCSVKPDWISRMEGFLASDEYKSLQESRKNALLRVSGLLDALKSKVHEGGKRCDKGCALQS